MAIDDILFYQSIPQHFSVLDYHRFNMQSKSLVDKIESNLVTFCVKTHFCAKTIDLELHSVEPSARGHNPPKIEKVKFGYKSRDHICFYLRSSLSSPSALR